MTVTCASPIACHVNLWKRCQSVCLGAEPRWTPLDRLRGVALYAAMIGFVAIPIWIAQGFLALLGVTLG